MKKWYDDSFWHRPLLDIWTIPHTLFGIAPAFFFAYLGWNMLFGLGITILAAFVWELGEISFGESDELFSNKVGDIIVAAAGYLLAWVVLSGMRLDQASLKFWLMITLGALIVTSIIGWIGFYIWHTR